MAVADSMEELNGMEIGRLRDWWAALVRVVAVVLGESYFCWLDGFLARNKNCNAKRWRG